MNIQELKDRLVELTESAKAIQAKADAEKRDLSADEATHMDQCFSDIESTQADIARRERLASIEARGAEPIPRRVAPAPINGDPPAGGNGTGVTSVAPRSAQERGRWGWLNFGDFAAAVRNAAIAPGAAMDPRLIQAASLSTYGTEGTGADGGFAVPPEWRANITQLVQAEDSLLGRTDQQQASGNTITFPNDETTAWQTSGGIQAFWDGEAAAMSQSKPKILPMTVRLNRLTALVPVTDELLEDSAAMGSYVQRKAGEKIAFKINDAIINGDGAGMPLGITNAGCKVSVARTTASKVQASDIANMWARLYGPSRRNAVWLINQDIEPQLYQMVITGKNVAGTENVGVTTPVFVPQGGFSASPFATMFGRPVITTEAAQTLGTEGDVILADLSNYLTVVKASGLRSDVSIHLWFDQATTAFRFIFRLAGQPWLSNPIQRKNGTNTLSHFVTLAA